MAKKLRPLFKAPADFPFSWGGRNWVRWWEGRTRHAAPASAKSAEAVYDSWAKRKIEIDRKAAVVADLSTETLSLKGAASVFLSAMRGRVDGTGGGRRMREATLADYIRTLRMLRDEFSPKKLVDTFGPDDFTQLAKRWGGVSPSTFGRRVAYTKSFFRWLYENGRIGAVPRYGSEFRQPAHEDVVDARLSQKKAHTPAELAAIWDVASLEERCWMALGLCGAMDNADVAELRDELEMAAGVIDYRRRKRGKKRRIVPLPSDVVGLLRLYRRPTPAGKDEGRFFLTPTGLPLGRMKTSRGGNLHRIDYVAMVWARLLVRAGLRSGGGDRRGFRSMRTTHANLAPPRSRDEAEIVMGHAKGMMVTHYLERDGMEGLRRHVESVWEATGLRPKLARLLEEGVTSPGRRGRTSPGLVPTSPDGVS